MRITKNKIIFLKLIKEENNRILTRITLNMVDNQTIILIEIDKIKTFKIINILMKIDIIIKLIIIKMQIMNIKVQNGLIINFNKIRENLRCIHT